MAWWQTLSAASEGAETGSARAAANVERAIRLRQALANQQQRELDQQTLNTTGAFPTMGGAGLTLPGGAAPAAPAAAGGTSTAAPAAPAGVAPRGRIPYPEIGAGTRPIQTYKSPTPAATPLSPILVPQQVDINRPATPPMAIPPTFHSDWDPEVQRQAYLGSPEGAAAAAAPVVGPMDGISADELALWQSGDTSRTPGTGLMADQLTALRLGAPITRERVAAMPGAYVVEQAAQRIAAGLDPATGLPPEAAAPQVDERLTGIKPLKAPEQYNLDEQQLLAARTQLAQQEAQAIAALEQRRQVNTQSYQNQYTQLVQQADNARRAGNTQQAAALMQQANDLLRQYEQADRTFADGISAARSGYQSAYDQADYDLYMQQIERGTSEIANIGDPRRLEQVLSAAEGREIQIVPNEDYSRFMIVEFDSEGNPVPRKDEKDKAKEFTADEVSNVVRMRVDDEYRAQVETSRGAAAQSALEFEREIAKIYAADEGDIRVAAINAQLDLNKARFEKLPTPDGGEIGIVIQDGQMYEFVPGGDVNGVVTGPTFRPIQFAGVTPRQ